jgi:hypothetical protein
VLTLFAIPKPFVGHIGVIQQNALESWARLQPRCEVLLMGDDAGTAEAATRFGFQHAGQVRRNEFGTPCVDDLFAQAQARSRHEILAYVNADIVLGADFIEAVERVRRWQPRFLVVGQRWDLDVTAPLEFSTAWEEELRGRLAQGGRLHEPTGIDYFVFPRGLWGELPPFAIGRTVWDNWLIYRARSLGAAVVDATVAITAVHQNHDYAHHPGGAAGLWQGPEARRNRELAGGEERVYDVRDADWRLTAGGVRRRWGALGRSVDRAVSRARKRLSAALRGRAG